MKILLGLGSNLGASMDTLRASVQELRDNNFGTDLRVVAISPIYESEAMLPADASQSFPQEWRRPYLNAVVEIETSLSPDALLTLTQKIETKLGRKQREQWAPREIDIDILCGEDLNHSGPKLNIPHVGFLERPFALMPAADIAPNWRDPLTGKSLRELSQTWRSLRVENVPYKTRRSRQTWTELVGVLNLTPDSFSDGGEWLDVDRALRQARLMIESGASVIDLGAESTRPGATSVLPAEEWSRLQPVLSQLIRLKKRSQFV